MFLALRRSSLAALATVAVGMASAVASAAVTLSVFAQDEPINGMRPADLRAHAIVGATVVTRPGEVLEGATILIRDGVIEAVGVGLTVPRDARVWDASGKRIYAGLIDPSVLVTPGVIERGPGSHWNRHVRPEINAATRDMPGEAVAKSLRELGFTAAAVYPDAGIFRGTGAVVSLAGDGNRPAMYRERAMMAVGFDRGGGYPGSLMGSIAAFRQTLYDAQWYQRSRRVWEGYPQGNEPPPRSDALAALDDVISRRQQVLFDVSDEHNLLRAARVMREFDIEGVILGSGTEFRRLSDVVAAGLPIIVPVNYPERPDVSTLTQADNTTLQTMLTWEQAPTNAKRLADAGATIALTTHALRNKSNFRANVRLAMVNGLTEDQALAALTTTPARLLGLSHVMGTIEPGKAANLVVADGPLFARDTKIRDTWIDGRRYEITPPDAPSYKGAGLLRVVAADGQPVETKVVIDTARKTLSMDLPTGEQARARTITFDGTRLSFLIEGRLFGQPGYVQFTGALTDGSFTGSGAMPDLSRFTFTITPTDDPVEVAAADDEKPEEGAAGERAAAPGSGPGMDDGITGEWSAIVTSEQMPDGIPMTLTLRFERGVLTGNLSSDFFTADITDGTFDRASGQVAFTVTGSGMTTRTEATVQGNAMTGRVSGQGFNADLAASRSVRAAASGGSGAGGRGGRGEGAEETPAPITVMYPLGEYGLSEPPRPQRVLIKNATIWTSGPQGVIENGHMLVEDGRIAAVSNRPFAPGAIGPDVLVIDATGKHVTPGLIDCHSHTGISGGVNEGSQAVTAEVRIADVIDPDDINWYRQLAGGLTAANQLHGSANPIGGQNSVVKLKWGGGAEDFPIRDAIPGIKFALGENVKRSQNRYPNTRMGVETIIRDSFTAAREYKAEWDRYLALPRDVQDRTMPPRKDLELDALVEILEGKRLVHCHSYRQDEILMLIRVADDFGFKIGTLQHILEGYKVAEAIAAHGAGASSFSDWWAYKVEVMDAIPYNGAIMAAAGITVSFNSDSNELARRMNTEASKAVRYGGVSPVDALKFVTINPARQLRIDHRTGSLEPGKDADFVIWSGDPLSTYTRCEQTWIEGARYFSIEQDQELRRQVARERQRLIQKILTLAHGDPAKTGGGAGGGEGEGRGGEGAGPGGPGGTGGRGGRPGGTRPTPGGNPGTPGGTPGTGQPGFLVDSK
ncbi:MAG: amidohydrolase family protein [Phycisphaerales bacterium]|nr:amidohydrolase family protein [Phycisphaerales bacterium]